MDRAPRQVYATLLDEGTYLCHWRSMYTEYRVQLRTLDDELERLGVDQVDFVKMDVEGFEAGCVRGGLNTIRKHRPYILFELNSRFGTDLVAQLREIVDPIKKLDYMFERDDRQGTVNLEQLEQSLLEHPPKLCNILCIPLLRTCRLIHAD